MHRETKILVTGASGFLGSRITAELETVGNVTGAGFSKAEGSLIPVDLRDGASVERLVDEVKPEVLVHCAAYRDPDFCEDQTAEAFRLNVAPVERFCELLLEDVPLLFISSDYVFDGTNPPYSEEDDRRPVNEYGRLKVGAEDLVLQRDRGLVLRIPLLIGVDPTGAASGFVGKTLARIRNPSPSSLDHAGIRFPTWTEDVARAVVHLLEMGGKGVFHYASLEGGTKYEWGMELARITGSSMEHISPDPDGSESRAARPRNTQLAVDKIRRTGFDRFTPFREAVESMLQ